MNDQLTKNCSKCKQEKPLTGFYRDKYGKFGRCSQCIECSYEHHPILKSPKETKICTHCGIEKNLEEFYHRKGSSDGRTSWCAVCQREKTRVYRQTLPKPPCIMCGINPKVAGVGKRYCQECYDLPKYYQNVDSNRSHQRKYKYGLDKDQLLSLLAHQEYKCPVCQDPLTIETLHVDHDHTCCPGKTATCGNCIRGLLCQPCNTSLGKFRDSIEVLQRAINYLTDPVFEKWKKIQMEEDINGRD